MDWDDHYPAEPPPGSEPWPTPLSHWVPALVFGVLIAAVVIAYAVLT